jgi:hypothetical protein
MPCDSSFKSTRSRWLKDRLENYFCYDNSKSESKYFAQSFSQGAICDDHYQHICLEAKHSLVNLAELRVRFFVPCENIKFY